MHIHTIEEEYEYRMKNIIKEFVADYELQDKTSEELQDIMYQEQYAKEFGRMVLTDMFDYAGDELFIVKEGSN